MIDPRISGQYIHKAIDASAGSMSRYAVFPRFPPCPVLLHPPLPVLRERVGVRVCALDEEMPLTLPSPGVPGEGRGGRNTRITRHITPTKMTITANITSHAMLSCRWRTGSGRFPSIF